MPAVTEIRDLPVELTAEEREAKCHSLAELSCAEADLAKQKSDAVKQFSQQIREARKKRIQIGRDVASNTEVRPVECRHDINYGNNEATVVRTDTGEVVGTEPIDESNRLLDLKSIEDEETKLAGK